MSRPFRALALSVTLLLATTGSAFAMGGPGGTIPPPQGSVTSTVLILLSVLGL
jgi:hypothetical protein